MSGSEPPPLVQWREALRWLAYAAEDQRVAHFIAAEEGLLGGTAFHVQQATEKVLKALLVAQQYTHRSTALDEEKNRLHCCETWSIDDARIAAFLAASSRETFVPGSGGMIRKVLTTGESVWVADVTEKADFKRGPLAREAGLRGYAVRDLEGVLPGDDRFTRAKTDRDALALIALARLHRDGRAVGGGS